MAAKKLIEFYMKRQNVTQKKIAKCFAISERTWRYWMDDPGERLTAYRLQVLERVLHLSKEELRQIVREV